MRVLSRLILFLVVGVPVALVIAGFLAIDGAPRIYREADVTPENIERARQILRSNDPRKLKAGEIRTVSVRIKDVDLAVNYLAQRYAHASARVGLARGRVVLRASVPLPGNPFGEFANVYAEFTEAVPRPRVASLRVGALPLPSRLGDWVIARALLQRLGEERNRFATAVIKGYRFGSDSVAVTYEWPGVVPSTVREAIVPPEDLERLRVYQERLADAVRSRASPTSLSELIEPLFSLGAERSLYGDPVSENRAAILVLTFYVNDRKLERAIPEAGKWPQPVGKTVTMNGRHDSAQHFIVSAAIAAHAGGPLADAMGVYKELVDSRGGSGFSFNDLAADRAGTRFGEWAEGVTTAGELQRRIRRGMRERDVMPFTADLPEFMQEAEFERRFGGTSSATYRRMMADIDRRVGALALYPSSDSTR
jgi:hypothetical protein